MSVCACGRLAARGSVRCEQCRKNAWAQEHRPVCACGQPRSRDATTCQACYEQATAARTHAYRARIAERWLAGMTSRQIAAELDTTQGTIHMEVVRMRRAGWNLPRRT